MSGEVKRALSINSNQSMGSTDHWPKRSLFGTNLESNKQMSNINYDNMTSWNDQQKLNNKLNDQSINEYKLFTILM